MLLCKKQHSSFHNRCIEDKPASQADGDTTTDNKISLLLLLCTFTMYPKHSALSYK